MIRAAFLLLCLGQLSWAAPVYYEGFNYVVAEDGLVGNGGFIANTAPAGADTAIVNGSLRYVDVKGNVLVTLGNSAKVDGSTEVPSGGSPAVSNVAPLNLSSVTGQTIWMSFIGQQTAGNTTRFFNVGLRAPDNTWLPADSGTTPDEILVMGMPSNATAQRWHLYDRGTNATNWQFLQSSEDSMNKAFLLARMELNVNNTVNERYTFWVNPRLDVLPADQDGQQFTSINSDIAAWTDLYQIRIAGGMQIGVNPASDWVLDEIRIGESFTDVTPHHAFQIISVVRDQQTQGLVIEWNAVSGETDVVEWSSNLQQWFPYAASSTTHPAGAVTAIWTTPAPPSGPFFLRVRRLL